MTDTKALIAEAREGDVIPRLTDYWTHLRMNLICGAGQEELALLFDAANLLRRLADALEEATTPEGWNVSGYTREDHAMVSEDFAGTWWITKPDGFTGQAEDGTVEFSTAREAISALDAQKAPPPGEG